MPNPDFVKQPRKNGKFTKTIEFGEKLREKAQKEHGYNIKEAEDYTDEMTDLLLRKKLINNQTKFNEFGFTEDFFTFLGLNGKAQNYHNPAPDHMISSLSEGDAAYFTPVDDFYGTPGGGDTVYDQGRIPVSHLMILASRRVGIVFRACNGTAGDVVRNRFEFVDPGEDLKYNPMEDRWEYAK